MKTTSATNFPGARNLFRFPARFFGAAPVARASSVAWTLKQAEARAPFALRSRRLALIPALLLAWLFGSANQTYSSWDYGDGRHGSFVLTTNATIEQLYQTVRLNNDPAQYNPADSNAIPNFQNLIITNGATLTANAWNGSAGGWIVIKVRGSLLIAAGSTISASSLGYRGGSYTTQSGIIYGIQGESYTGSQATSTSANGGGGGGGGGNRQGGGGGYGTSGGSGNGFGSSYEGSGGGTYGAASLSTVYLGSGGGGGGNASSPSVGANGGGAIILNAGNLNAQGGIQAAGGSSGNGGSSGSGGSILLNVAFGFLGTTNVNASGGYGTYTVYGYGGNGGDGRIAVDYAESVTGVTTPAAYTFNDTNSDTITITNQPTPQSIFLGSNVLFNVGFSTLSPNTMQWYFTGTPIPGATNHSLSLFNLSLTNQGNYWLTISNVVMSLNSSNVYLTVLDTNVPFGDGIPNWWKSQYGLSLTDPTLATNYPPGDKLTYLEKYLYSLNPLTPDTDGDGLSDYDELFVYGTDPLKADTDGDGIPDGWEVQHGLNPLVNDAARIGPAGVSNLQIYQYDLAHTNQLDQLDPHNPFFAPGTSIYEVLNNGQHTNRFYYDREDRLVGAEYSRGIAIAYQYDGNGNLTRQKVLSRANETNGLPVLWQFLNGLTNGTAADGPFSDADGDGWSNYQEWLAGTSPTSAMSTPNLLGNPGTNIASLALPFTPSNFVVGVGQLDGQGAEDIVLGADGNPGTNVNFLLVLTQTTSGWSTQRVDVGTFGITSIAVGQVTNRPSAGIYVGLRGTTNGSGRVMEFTSNGGLWQSNVVALSTNQTAFVLGVRGQDVLVSLATTNAPDGSLSAVNFATNWNLSLKDTNTSHRGLGIVANLRTNQTSLRLLDSGGIQTGHAVPLPTNSVYRAASGSWFFVTPIAMTWSNAESFAQTYGGHLASIADASENEFVRSIAGDAWIGLNDAAVEGTFVWSSGEPLTFANWNPGEPNNGPGGEEDGVLVDGGTGKWWDTTASSLLSGVIETSHGVLANVKLLPEPSATRTNNWRGLNVASGVVRTATNEAYSVFYSFADDKNANGMIDFADDFVTAEYLASGTNASLLTLSRQPIASLTPAQSYGLASVNFLNANNEVFFTGEPDGRVFAWTATGATNPLQRLLFSGHHAGKAWHALAGVRTLEPGEGLIGLRVDPVSPNKCDVILWLPQSQLSQLASLPNTAPAAAVLPPTNTLGNLALVTVRLWDAEGNASTPFLQYQISGSTNWQSATLVNLDGGAYSASTRVAASPGGVNHTVVWNAQADLGGNVVTNILLRARASDFALLGDWSAGTPFAVNTVTGPDADGDGLPDAWEIEKLHTLAYGPGDDPDQDGFNNWQEYVADTNPLDAQSNLRVTGFTYTPTNIVIEWRGGIQATQYLQRLDDLGTNTWQNIATSYPPTPILGSYTNAPGTNQMMFYRIKATR